MQHAPKNVVMIGGPNGAGKTTWAYRRLDGSIAMTDQTADRTFDRILQGLRENNAELSRELRARSW
jgi:ABC-type cobalamin/Fe3+-siderophores transport system ATPase subunit